MANWFITGTSTGLGRSLATAALAAGHTVVGTMRSPAALGGFAELAEGRAHGLLLDVTDAAAVTDAIAAAEALTGGLDVVVNNAGHGMTGAIEESSLAQVRALFEVNVLGSLAVIQAALPYFRSRRAGHIVNISSVSGLAAWSGTGIYGASKFALECIGRTLAQEVNPLGIKVTSVCPGGLRTEFAGAALIEADGHIPDYAETAHLARPTLLGHHGREPGDPMLAALAILEAVAAPKPPLTLLLGPDALKYAEYEFASVAADIGAWRELTLSIAADPAAD
jgi:NAD(P)-dependent dehydrogenase (short-subunit alcohol dehydrogenase family)